jgi:hypothetical protein
VDTYLSHSTLTGTVQTKRLQRGPWSRSRANRSLKSNTVIKAAYISGGLNGHPF